MRTAPAFALLILIAACGSTQTAQMPTPPGARPAAAAPGLAAAAGPFRVHVTRCGRYTPAERATFGTNATSGMIATVTNASRSATASVQVSAEFADGGTVQDPNTSGFTPALAPGQSAAVAVDNVYGAGLDGNPADRCTAVSYAVMTGSTYTGTWQVP